MKYTPPVEEFPTRLKMRLNQIKYRAGYKYQLVEPVQLYTEIHGYEACNQFCTLGPTGWLRIREGYAWDGPSGPAVDTPSFMRASLAHDALYQLIKEGHLPFGVKPDADRLMYRLCRVDGMWPPRAWWCLQAVRRFGASHLQKEDQTGILTAP